MTLTVDTLAAHITVLGEFRCFFNFMKVSEFESTTSQSCFALKVFFSLDIAVKRILCFYIPSVLYS